MSNPQELRDTLTNPDFDESGVQHKLEIYKLSVEMADRTSARRLTANSFFLTINTGIIAFAGYLSLSADKNLAVGQYWAVALAGLILCYMWYRLIRSYAGLNKAKFDVINAIERDLPYQTFDAEWIALGSGRDPKKYLPFTKIEMLVPWVFFALHAVVLLKSVPLQEVESWLSQQTKVNSVSVGYLKPTHLVVVSGLNVRVSASIKADVIDKLQHGQYVTISKTNGNWSLISVSLGLGKVQNGWVYSEYLKPLEN